jgi:hypothetical protein
MPELPSLLIAGSALILLVLGALHLVFTFHGRRLQPRNPAVRDAMQADDLVLTRQTTVWKAWIGFNASHGLGAVLFGLVYGYLALAEARFLFGRPFLLTVGALALAAYLVLARRYWFKVPLRGVMLATTLYAAALVLGA